MTIADPTLNQRRKEFAACPPTPLASRRYTARCARSVKIYNLTLRGEALGLNQLRYSLVAQNPLQLQDGGLELQVR
ncbi:MAG TPA: hypothetical protein VIH18_22010 [Candidatus Binatia bacterium]|jgi:hypothetical protein